MGKSSSGVVGEVPARSRTSSHGRYSRYTSQGHCQPLQRATSPRKYRDNGVHIAHIRRYDVQLRAEGHKTATKNKMKQAFHGSAYGTDAVASRQMQGLRA